MDTDQRERVRMTSEEVEVDDSLSSSGRWTRNEGGMRWASTSSLMGAMEKRTQKTYRYGIGLVCIGATLNWLGFAQGHGYIDPLRYLGVACVITGSFCVCMAMCRWLGKPIAVSSSNQRNQFQFLDDTSISRQYGGVHVINVTVPTYTPSSQLQQHLGEGGYGLSLVAKPPDYDALVNCNEPPSYDEAIKLFESSKNQNVHVKGCTCNVPIICSTATGIVITQTHCQSSVITSVGAEPSQSQSQSAQRGNPESLNKTPPPNYSSPCVTPRL